MTDWDAERYHQLSNPQLGWGRRVLERLAPSPGERILDLGCGTGRLTMELASVIGHGFIVAVDRSDAMIREAAAQLQPLSDKQVRQRGPHRLEADAVTSAAHFVRADGTQLPFVDAFDAVLSTATFHWIRDHNALFASIYRALVPGGRLVAQCGGGPNLKSLIDRANALAQTRKFERYFDGWHDPWEFADVPTTIQRLDRASFTAIDVYLEEAPTTLPDRDTYLDFVSTVCVREHVARLPEASKRAFLDALADQAAADAEPFTLDYWRLNILARKPAGIEQAA
jgi:trans-aconitate 2-methyltransferase